MAQRDLLMGRRGVCSDLAIAPSARTLFARSQQPEEARARLVRSCYLFGDLGQGRITGAGILEPIFRHRDGVGPAMPFADKARTQIGKTALARGLALDLYAFPNIGVPRHSPIGPEIDRSVIYSVARTESCLLYTSDAA